MQCPYSKFEDTNSEKFCEWSAECKNCRHFQECLDKEKSSDDSVCGDNYPTYPKLVPLPKPKMHIQIHQSERDKISKLYGEIDRTEIQEMKYYLDELSAKELWKKLENKEKKK